MLTYDTGNSTMENNDYISKEEWGKIEKKLDRLFYDYMDGLILVQQLMKME